MSTSSDQKKTTIVVQHFDGSQVIIKGVFSYAFRMSEKHQKEIHIRDAQFKHRRFVLNRIQGLVIS